MLGKKAAYAVVSVGALGLALATPTAAFADDDGLLGSIEFDGQGHGGVRTTVAKADLDPLNHTEAEGKAFITLRGREANVVVFARDVLEDAPHAQHFHIQGRGECPTMAADTNGDGIISTVEGRPAYGRIGASLTTEGDTSPASALAVKRFPTAPNGFITYQRTFTVNAATAESIREGNAVVVVHGIDTINPSGAYDGEPRSLLNPALPLEATAPAACGGVDTIVSVGGSLDLEGFFELNLDELLDPDFAEDFSSDFDGLGEDHEAEARESGHSEDSVDSDDQLLGGSGNRLTDALEDRSLFGGSAVLSSVRFF